LLSSIYPLNKFVQLLRNLVLKVPDINLLALGLSVGGFAFLYLGKDVFATRLRRLVPIALPIELILVLVVTAVSYGANFRDNYNITVLTKVPSGYYYSICWHCVCQLFSCHLIQI
jgi:MFS superfamily sulfate permease-like transporter